MSKRLRFPYTSFGSSLMPFIPISFQRRGQNLQTVALVDSGASVNVLPYEIGLQLGAIWEEQTQMISLAGNLAKHEARAIVIRAQVGALEPIRLVFAWTNQPNMRLILGQQNFFQQFQVCFFGDETAFEVMQK